MIYNNVRVVVDGHYQISSLRTRRVEIKGLAKAYNSRRLYAIRIMDYHFNDYSSEEYLSNDP